MIKPKNSQGGRFADEQDGRTPWDVHTTSDARDGKKHVELVGISARTPWEQKPVDEGEGAADSKGRKRRRRHRRAREGEDEDEDEDEDEAGEGKKAAIKTLTEEEDEEVRKAVAAVRRARALAESKRAAVGRDEDWDLPAHARHAARKGGNQAMGGEQAVERQICLSNYAAVGAGDTAVDDRGPETAPQGRGQPVRPGTRACYRYYGLIDQGKAQDGVRCLIMHAPPSRRKNGGGADDGGDGDRPTDRVRPGSVLRVHSTAPGGRGGRLRVRFTTPERYYAPGTRVSTLRIGVDAADWESLTPGV